jgi:nitrogen fixation NifU-like protein
MSELQELYHELIIDHGRKPRNFMVLPNANYVKEGFNPLCGDKITLYLDKKEGVIERASFQGSGCAISMASASLLTEAVKGKTIEQAQILFNNFHAMLVHADSQQDYSSLGKLAVLSGVGEYPARVKCATLAWHTLIAAIEENVNPVTTEVEV